MLWLKPRMVKSDWRMKVVMSVLVALVSLVGFSDFLPHTDDGCAVETHCLACRSHLSAVSGLALSASVLTGPNEFTRIETVESRTALDVPAGLRPPGRAPPLPA